MKKRQLRRWIFACCVLAILMCLLPRTQAQAAAGGTCGPNLRWTYADGTLTISGNGEMTNYSSTEDIPWYNFGASIKTVNIAQGVTTIGINAFCKCTGLRSVTIADSVIGIGAFAFYKCTGLTSITIADSVTSIGKYAFYQCTGLTSITIPDSVTSIDHYAFEDCTALRNITISDNVTNIETDAFRNTAYYNNEDNWDNGVLYIGNHLIKARSSLSGKYEVRKGTKCIGGAAFSDIFSASTEACAGLTSIMMPDSVTGIGAFAFYKCTGLTSITIPDSVTSIGENAFYKCTGLTSVQLPNSISRIENSTFNGCTRLISITIPDGVSYIDDEAFYDCTGLTSVTIPASVTSWGNDVFTNAAALVLKIEETNTKAIQLAKWDSIPYKTYSTKIPEKPIVQTVSLRKIVLQPLAGYEYSVDGITWQDSAVFSGLLADTTYTFYQRTKETELACAGAASEGTVVKTLSAYPAIQIGFDSTPVYTGEPIKIKPVVSAGGIQLDEGIDYTLSYENNIVPGNGAVVTVTMVGDDSMTAYRRNFAILKPDVSRASISIDSCAYSGGQKQPKPTVVMNGVTLAEGTDYVVQYRNNVAVGTAYAKIIGIGNYCGCVEKAFQITADTKVVTLYGSSYPSYYTSTVTMAPGAFRGLCNSSLKIFSSFTLKDVSTGKTLKNVDYTSMGYASSRDFYYDFSANASATTVNTYSLAYSWTDYNANSYAGILTIIVTGGPGAPESISMTQAQEEDPRYDYLAVESHWSTKLPTVIWQSSDPSVATVDNGVVLWKKEGSVTITAKASGLTATKKLTATQQDLSGAILKMTDADTQEIAVIYHGYLLEENADYTVSKTVTDTYVEITVSGCGIFRGTAAKRFTTGTVLQHRDDYVVSFVYADGAVIEKQTYHYGDGVKAPTQVRVPAALGEDYYFSGWDRQIENCYGDAVYTAVFARKYSAGDTDGDRAVTCDDVIYILLHTLFGEEFYPLHYAPADVDGSGTVNEGDAICLLRYILFGEAFYPLNASDCSAIG